MGLGRDSRTMASILPGGALSRCLDVLVRYIGGTSR